MQVYLRRVAWTHSISAPLCLKLSPASQKPNNIERRKQISIKYFTGLIRNRFLNTDAKVRMSSSLDVSDDELVTGYLQDLMNTKHLFEETKDPIRRITLAAYHRTIEGRILSTHIHQGRIEFRFRPDFSSAASRLEELVNLLQSHRVSLCDSANKQIREYSFDKKTTDKADIEKFTYHMSTRVCHELRLVNALHDIIEEQEISIKQDTMMSWFATWNKIFSIINQFTVTTNAMEIPVQVPLKMYGSVSDSAGLYLNNLQLLRSIVYRYHPDPREFLADWAEKCSFPPNDFNVLGATKFMRKRWKEAESSALDDTVTKIEGAPPRSLRLIGLLSQCRAW